MAVGSAMPSPAHPRANTPQRQQQGGSFDDCNHKPREPPFFSQEAPDSFRADFQWATGRHVIDGDGPRHSSTADRDSAY